MVLNALRIRLALMAMGLVGVIVFMALGGRFGPGDKGVIQIDYSIEPRQFAGVEVVIDGQPAGTLRPFGNACRTGFEVKKGLHQVVVQSPDFNCEPRRVDVDAGRSVLLILDVQESTAVQGAAAPMLALR